MKGLAMEYGPQPPLFLGGYPLTVGVQAICVLHAIVCLAFVACASSVVTITLGTYQVSTGLQIAASTYHLIGISVIAGALAGTISRSEFPLRVYFYYMLIGTLCWGAGLIRVLQRSGDCSFVRESTQSQRIGINFSCGMVTAAWIFCTLVVFMCQVYCCFAVWHLKEHLAGRDESQHLLEHEDPATKKLRQGGHLGMEKGRSPFSDLETHMTTIEGEHQPLPPPTKTAASWAAPRPGHQPEWGSTPIRTTTVEL